MDGSAIEVARFMFNGGMYRLLDGGAHTGADDGLSGFDSYHGVGGDGADIRLLGCASKEIAEHVSRYFAKEIFEVRYGDIINYEWI